MEEKFGTDLPTRCSGKQFGKENRKRNPKEISKRKTPDKNGGGNKNKTSEQKFSREIVKTTSDKEFGKDNRKNKFGGDSRKWYADQKFGCNIRRGN